MLLSNLLLAFMTGIISSFGHCIGMCGGIVAIYSARQTAVSAAADADPGVTNPARPDLLSPIRALLPVHAGRILTYTFLGALIGLAGSLLDQAGPTQTLTIPVLGMSCASCVARVEGGLRAVPGVLAVQVDLAGARATVEINPNQVTPAALRQAVKSAGYEVPE